MRLRQGISTWFPGGNPFKKYRAVFALSFKMQLTWRFDLAMNLLFGAVRIIFAVVLWGAIFSQRGAVSGFTLETMLVYYIVSALLASVDLSDEISGEIGHDIRAGLFSKYMVIPAGPQGYFMALVAGHAAYCMLFQAGLAGLWMLLLGVRLPRVAPGLLLGAVALALLGRLLMMQLHFFLGVLTFRFQEIGLFRMIAGTLMEFATGALIPLALLPGPLQSVMRLAPFYYVTYLPAMLSIGRLPGQLLPGLGVLLGWIAFFFLLNRVSYKRLRVRYDGVGI